MNKYFKLLAVLFMNSAVFAAPLSYEGFDYTGDLAGNGSGSGFTGNWSQTTGDWTVSAGSLSYPDLEASGNRVVSVGNVTHIGARQMAAAAPSSGEFWASILVDTQGFDAGGLTFSNNATGNLDLNSTVFADRARFGFGINGSNYVYKLDGREGSPISGSVAGATGDTTFLVAKFDVSNGLFSMWANPDVGGVNPVGGTQIADNVSFVRNGSTFAGDVTYAGLYANWGGVQLDEVRLGTDFAGVAIPEPSTLVLLVVGFAGAIITAKRRR